MEITKRVLDRITKDINKISVYPVDYRNVDVTVEFIH